MVYKALPLCQAQDCKVGASRGSSEHRSLNIKECLQLPILVGGAVIIENIFNLPGLGRLMLGALNDRDYPVVAGINLVFATAVMGINLMIDLVYAFLDPRVRYQQ